MKDMLLKFIELVGTITTIFAILMFFVSLASWLFGVAPLLYRIGFARWKRELKIVASAQIFSELKADLTKSGVFREKNIKNVSTSSIAEVNGASLVLIHYQYLTPDQIKLLLQHKTPRSGYIFYFPEFNPPANVIPADLMKQINDQPFTTVVNFRGRLVNDLVVTMLSTSYKL